MRGLRVLTAYQEPLALLVLRGLWVLLVRKDPPVLLVRAARVSLAPLVLPVPPARQALTARTVLTGVG